MPSVFLIKLMNSTATGQPRDANLYQHGINLCSELDQLFSQKSLPLFGLSMKTFLMFLRCVP